MVTMGLFHTVPEIKGHFTSKTQSSLPRIFNDPAEELTLGIL